MQTEVEKLKKELALAKLENASLRLRLKNAELMYQFAAEKLVESNQSFQTEDQRLHLSN